MHDDELVVTDDVVRALIDRQLPRFSALPLTRLPSSGSSNVLSRLGDDLLVRLPRQPGGSSAIDKEAKYLPLIASAISVQLPVIVAVGEPDLDYPERWSVLRWINGQTPVAPVPPGPDATGLALDLAAVVAELRAAVVPRAAHADPALSSYRGGPIRAIDTGVRQYLAGCRALGDLQLDFDACDRFWTEAMSVPEPPSDSAPRWIHADLLAENVLLRGGRLAAILDFGGLALGDPSVDLIAAWELLNAEDRAIFRSTLDIDDAEWERGRAWAFAIAVMTFPYYWHTLTQRCAHRLGMVHAVLHDHATEP
ncbi:MAG: aminoglycoside phosphotransferase family protein [Actinomycetota bacterium]|nr:aminoglycoside phosphotransferase family protein [Actinomycetota bacterium]